MWPSIEGERRAEAKVARLLVALDALSQRLKDHQVGESLATRELDALIAAHRPTQAITRKAERQARSEGTAEAIPPGVRTDRSGRVIE